MQGIYCAAQQGSTTERSRAHLLPVDERRGELVEPYCAILVEVHSPYQVVHLAEGEAKEKPQLLSIHRTFDQGEHLDQMRAPEQPQAAQMPGVLCSLIGWHLCMERQGVGNGADGRGGARAGQHSVTVRAAGIFVPPAPRPC